MFDRHWNAALEIGSLFEQVEKATIGLKEKEKQAFETFVSDGRLSLKELAQRIMLNEKQASLIIEQLQKKGLVGLSDFPGFYMATLPEHQNVLIKYQ